jgi:salicylate 5-hydroxylase large subunit
MISRRNEGGENKAVTEGVTSFKADMALHDDRLLDVVPEPWWKVPDPPTPAARSCPPSP